MGAITALRNDLERATSVNAATVKVVLNTVKIRHPLFLGLHFFAITIAG